jgi:serine/threonine-protein kinase
MKTQVSTPLSAQDLLATVRRMDLLEAAHLEEASYFHQTAAADAASLTHWMRQRGWITSFQAERLLNGEAGKLALGSYRLLEPIGEGGMGHVFKARHQRLGRTVALKVIRPELLGLKDEVLRRFEREARAAAQLLHPNVVTLYDADEVDGLHYIAMEYVEGIDLARLVEKSGALGLGQACDFVRQAALGLQHAYEAGLVHRDIKPSNLLLSRRPASDSGQSPVPAARKSVLNAFGQIKVLDLGLARLSCSLHEDGPASAITQQGTVLGTPDYISPEQARNPHTVDVRADLYSLGCTFYFLLTSQPPFPQGTAVEKLLKHQLDTARPAEELRPGLPADVATVVRRLMAKNPADRYQTPLEVASALEAVLRSAEVAHAPDRPASRPKPPVDLEQSNSVDWSGVPSLSFASTLDEPAVVYNQARRTALLEGHDGCLTALAFSPDGRWLATAGIDQSVRVWDLTGRLVQESAVLPGPLGEVHALAFAPGREHLAAGAAAPHGLVWDWAWPSGPGAGRAVAQADPGGVRALAYSPDGLRLAAVSGPRVWLWAVSGKKFARKASLLGHATDPGVVAFAPDGRRFASGGDNGVIDLWQIGRIWTGHTNVLAGHHGPVTALAYSPDGSLLVSGGLDKAVRVWDATGAEAGERRLLSGLQRSVRSVRFLAGGKRLIAVDDGGHLTLWDAATWAKLREWVIDKTLVVRLALGDDGTTLATGGSDGNVILFQLDMP